MTVSRRGFVAGLAGAAAWAQAVESRCGPDDESTPKAAANPGDVNRMPADPLRDLPAGRTDLGTLTASVRQLAELSQYRPFLTGGWASYAAFQSEMRKYLLDTLQYTPAAVDPRPELLERRDMGDYVRERILFSTSPQFRVPAYVLVPKRPTRPLPAIVDLHSHGGMFLFGKEKVIDLGTNHPVMVDYHQRNYDGRPTATELVRRGYLVISIDAFMFGERRILLEADHQHGWDRSQYSVEVARQLNTVCRSKESTIVKGLTFAGTTWPGIVFWDDMRTVDYLLTRSDVDPRRIGCLGISMGGYRSLFLTALDSRVRAGGVVGFMSTTRSMLNSHLDTHSFVHFLPALHRALDWPDVATLAADRALLVQQCQRDGLFPLSGMQQSLEQIGAVFARQGRADKFFGRFYDEPHQFTRTMQDDAFAWLDQQLSV